MSSHEQIENWILDYGLQDPAERMRIEAFVKENPEWEDCLRSARQWDALLRDARKLTDPNFDEEMLPYAIASRTLPHGDSSGPIRRLLARLFRRVELDEDRRALRDLYGERRSTSENASHVAQHFEEVTGHLIRERFPKRPRAAWKFPHAPRPSRTRSRGVFAARLVRTAAVFLFIYVGLFMASTLRDAPIERLAHLTDSDLTWTALGVSTRGDDDAAWEELMTGRYDTALAVAASSRKTFLGLFPAYRIDRLRDATQLLEETIAFQLSREPAPAHAFLTLAKLHFLSGETLKSFEALRAIIENDRSKVQSSGFDPVRQ